MEEYISLKSDHQKLFFDHQELQCENLKLKNEIVVLKKTIEEHKTKYEYNLTESNVLREKKILHAKLKQLKRLSTSCVTPKKTPLQTKEIKRNESQTFEVEQLLKHRSRKGYREFYVRWKGYTDEHNTWEKEANLSCPAILNKYLKLKKLKA